MRWEVLSLICRYPPLWSPGGRPWLTEGVDEAAETGRRQLDAIARRQLPAELVAGAVGQGAGADELTRNDPLACGRVREDFGDRPPDVACRSAGPLDAVDLGDHLQVRRVELIDRSDPRSHRSREILALRWPEAARQLSAQQVAAAQIVEQGHTEKARR